MTPYYQQDWIVIFHADCREVLPSLAPVDLLLTDPPYGIALANHAKGLARSDRSFGILGDPTAKGNGSVAWWRIMAT